MENFNSKVEALLRQLHWWKARDLSLRGKVLIIKALALSKFQYLASLVTIPDHVIKQVNSIIYDFIWNGKTDKVKRNLFEQDFKNGGYKMINFTDIITASSVMWVQKYLDYTEREWKHTLEWFSNRKNLKLFLMSNFDVEELPTRLPSYYINAIRNWSRLSGQSKELMNNICLQPLWYNREFKIGFKSVYNHSLLSIGMWCVGDLFTDGNLIPFDVWLNRGAREVDGMTWGGLVKSISKKWNIQDIFHDQSSNALAFTRGLNMESTFVCIEKITQKQVKELLAQNKLSSLKDTDFKYKIKHELIHGTISDEEWENIFIIPTLCPVDNKTKDLQYKIIMRFIPTNKLLYKMNRVNSQTCSFCHMEIETVEHLFFNCVNVKDIWIYVFKELQKKTNTHFVPDLRSCILGVYDENVDNVKIINTVMLLVKMYIMNCKYDRGILSRVAFVRIFMYKVTLLGRLYENDVFVQLAQMFAET